MVHILKKKVLENQLDYLVDDTLGSFKIFMPELSDNIKKTIIDYKLKPNVDADEAVKNNNKKIIKKASIAIRLLIVFVLSKKMDKEGMTNRQFYTKLIKYNLITIIFIGLTEYIFAAGFAKNYISIDMNYIKKNIVDNLIKLKIN